MSAEHVPGNVEPNVTDAVMQEIRDLLHGYVPKGYITLKQLSVYLGDRPANTIREWMRTGGFPSYKPGKELLFKITEVDLWMSKKKKGAA